MLLVGVEPSYRWRTFTEPRHLARAGARRRARRHARRAPRGRAAHASRARDGAATDPRLVEELGLELSRYEGPTGIVGVLHDACRQAGIRSVSLWAAVPHYVSLAPSPRAARALVAAARPSSCGVAIDVDRARRGRGRVRPPRERGGRVGRGHAGVRRGARAARPTRSSSSPRAGQLPTGDSIAAELTRFLREQERERDDDDTGARPPSRRLSGGGVRLGRAVDGASSAALSVVACRLRVRPAPSPSGPPSGASPASTRLVRRRAASSCGDDATCAREPSAPAGRRRARPRSPGSARAPRGPGRALRRARRVALGRGEQRRSDGQRQRLRDPDELGDVLLVPVPARVGDRAEQALALRELLARLAVERLAHASASAATSSAGGSGRARSPCPRRSPAAGSGRPRRDPSPTGGACVTSVTRSSKSARSTGVATRSASAVIRSRRFGFSAAQIDEERLERALVGTALGELAREVRALVEADLATGDRRPEALLVVVEELRVDALPLALDHREAPAHVRRDRDEPRRRREPRRARRDERRRGAGVTRAPSR